MLSFVLDLLINEALKLTFLLVVIVLIIYLGKTNGAQILSEIQLRIHKLANYIMKNIWEKYF